MQKLINGEWVDCTEQDLINGDTYRIPAGNGGWQQQAFMTPTVTPIRIISTGAMQRRFTIPEEVAIASDDAATVIKSRLMNASYCDLDFQDTIAGVNYIVDYLVTAGLVVDAVTRKAELLQDGTKEESI